MAVFHTKSGNLCRYRIEESAVGADVQASFEQSPSTADIEEVQAHFQAVLEADGYMVTSTGFTDCGSGPAGKQRMREATRMRQRFEKPERPN